MVIFNKSTKNQWNNDDSRRDNVRRNFPHVQGVFQKLCRTAINTYYITLGAFLRIFSLRN